MADRTIVAYEEIRNPEGPHWRLRVERSAAGAPSGLVVIEFESVDGSIPGSEMSVVLDDLRRLQPALDWANGGGVPRSPNELQARLERQTEVYRRIQGMALTSRWIEGDALLRYLAAAMDMSHPIPPLESEDSRAVIGEALVRIIDQASRSGHSPHQASDAAAREILERFTVRPRP